MGEGWGEGIPRISAIFPNTLTAQIQALRLVALSLTLSHGREDGAAVGIKGSARKTASCSPNVGCVRYARTRSPFSLQSQPTACVPYSTRPTDGFKGRLKKRLRRLFHLLCDKRLSEKFLLLMFRAFFFRRPATLESAATRSLPRDGGLGRGHSPNGGNLP